MACNFVNISRLFKVTCLDEASSKFVHEKPLVFIFLKNFLLPVCVKDQPSFDVCVDFLCV